MRTLTDRVVIVTGANQGFGKEVAHAFVGAGANVVACARNVELLEAAAADLASLCVPGQKVLACPADISRMEDCLALAQKALKTFGHIDILVNNAGVYGPKGLIEDIDWEDWVRSIEINLFGSILMCRAVLPAMKRQRYGKIIQLSGGGATKPMPRFSAYATAKAAIVRFAETLAKEVWQDHIDVNCIAPGALNTRLLDEVLAAGPEKVGQDFYERSLKQKESGGADLTKGTDLALFLASDISDGITGKLISAIWDPWRTLPEHLGDLNSDVYTLRRIVPEDRALTW